MDLTTVCSKGTKYQKRNRIGRGIGSGNGKTSGRGHKGLGSRSGSSRRAGYEGGQMPIYRQVPKRGFTNARFRTDYTIINVGDLGSFDDGATVDLTAILDRGLASKTSDLLKVLGNGELSKKLTVRTQKISKSARAKIEAAGGTVVELDKMGRVEGEASATGEDA
ncbi:MAG: 50S ribosomal protein L15 [Planctomycetota bacterium]